MDAARGILMVPMARTAEAEASFDALLSEQRRRLYGIAYSILRDHGEAEDALQEAMVRAWRSWDSVREESARRTWMVRICVNQCINRRRGLRQLRLSRAVDSQDPASPDPRFDGRLVDLDRSYRRLSSRQRAAVFLHYHHGYSIEECAVLMSCRPGSVRTHVARALKAMRKEMANV